MKNNKRTVLATTALPYANGPLHLGHLVEGIQADMWVRSMRLAGHECHFISGSDAHGTSIMLSAEKAGISPEAHVAAIRSAHEADLARFHVEFDLFHTTHSDLNRARCTSIYEKLLTQGHIKKQVISQAFDAEKQMFLADRFIRGTCPRCRAEDQYGDHCEQCGATYAPTELIDARSVMSGQKPIEKETEHLYFKLADYQAALTAWLSEGRVNPSVYNKLSEWLAKPLLDWDISRDAPYFGFKIPGYDDKYFYVWLDAPIAYMAAFEALCQTTPGLSFDAYWAKNSTAELHHFVGKDIVYFHALFWPALLEASGYRLPTRVHTHGFLTINAQKMSKSRFLFITAAHYAEHFSPEYLRYYFAAKCNGQIDDIDLNFEDFVNRINSDLIGKYINLASRTAKFITQYFEGNLSDALADETAYAEFVAASETIFADYDGLNTNRAVREIMRLADVANQYVSTHAPWQLIKADNQSLQVQQVCTQALNYFRLLTLYLKPILPKTADKVMLFLQVPNIDYAALQAPLLSHQIAAFSPMMQRLDLSTVVSALSDER
jgi:methionyl-tRNA synthetase